MNTTRTLTDTQLKCSSLPPGLTAPGAETKLNRSKSNAGSKSQDHFSPLQEDAEKEDKPSLFERIFPRKSGRKKKSKEEKETTTKVSRQEIIVKHEEEKIVSVSNFKSSQLESYRVTSSKPIPAPRSGAASRQRVVPIDIPASPDEVRRDLDVVVPKSSPERSPAGTSPLQQELENRFKQRQILSTSPKTSETPPLSPDSDVLPSVISTTTEVGHYTKTSSITVSKYQESKTRSEEIKNKLKIPGLSSLQQRVLSLNDDDTENGFLSLTDFPTDKPSKPVTKSHSFKSAKPRENKPSYVRSKTSEFLSRERNENSKASFTKAASLDSVKNLEEPVHRSELKLALRPVKKEAEVFRDSITISGPSHTAVVNVTSCSEDFTSNSSDDGVKTVSQVSVTKIQVKRETTQVTQSTVTVPEFLGKQLNRVEIRPSSNIILSMKSPKPLEDQNRPKTLFNFEPQPEVTTKPPTVRKFSKEDLEIIEIAENAEQSPKTPPATIVSPQNNRFKKNEAKSGSRKSSVVSITPESPVKEKAPVFKTSLDSLKNESDRSSQDSLDKLEEKQKSSTVTESVVLRRKSLASKRNDEEPELMKVFARRSLKLKDSDVDSIQEQLAENTKRDSDKENRADSPVQKKKDDTPKSPLSENPKEPSSPVALRRNFNNNIFLSQRAVSLNPPPRPADPAPVKKQQSFSERRLTDQWMSKIRNEEPELREKGQEEIIAADFITEPKNFNQRKAEWEKRAQQAQKKNTP